MRKTQLCFIALLLLLSCIAATPVQAQSTNRLVVQIDADNPESSFIPACQRDVPVMRLKFIADVTDIQVTDFYLVNTDPNTDQVINTADGLVSSVALHYGNKSRTATLSNGLIHFSFGEDSDFIVRENDPSIVTVSITPNGISSPTTREQRLHLVTTTDAVAGGSLDPNSQNNFVSGTSKGVRAKFLVNGSVIEPGNVKADSNIFAVTKSKPYFLPVAKPGMITMADQTEIYRFNVVADPCGSLELGTLSFDIALGSVNLRNISLYRSTDTSTPLNTFGPDLIGGSGTVKLNLDKYAPSSGEGISAGSTKTYVLKADIQTIGFIGTHTVSTKLAGETHSYQTGEYFTVSSGQIAWSDESSSPHGLSVPASPDWYSGNYFPELPTENMTFNDRNNGGTSGALVSIDGHPDTIMSVTADTVTTFTTVEFRNAGDVSLMVYGLKLTRQSRQGNGNSNDFTKLWLEDDNGPVSNSATLDSNNQATFFLTNPFNLSQGGWVELQVKGSLVNNGSGQASSLGIDSSSDVFVGAGNITGTFPMSGDSWQMRSGGTTNSNQNQNNTNASSVSIVSVTGPSVVERAKSATWTVFTNPSNANVTYSVDWNDGNEESKNSPVFTHSFEQTGVYQPSFRLSSNDARTRLTIRVGNARSNVPSAVYTDPILSNAAAYTNPFVDVMASTDLGKAALELYRRGVVSGYSDNTLQANKPVNRAEALKMLFMLRDGHENLNTNPTPFADVRPQAWYNAFIFKAYAEKIVHGYDDGLFHPEQSVSTAEFLKMMTLILDLDKNLPYQYFDVHNGDWFAPYAGVAAQYQLFPQKGNLLNPNQPLSRGDVIQGLYQYLKNS